MKRLTEKRLEAAKSILEDHRECLLRIGDVRVHKLDNELRECWGSGSTTMKRFIVELFKLPRHQLLAARFMQFSNAPHPVAEFKRRLVQLYGQEVYDHSGAMKFWESFAIKRNRPTPDSCGE